MSQLRRCIAGVVPVALVVALACAVNPVTGKRELSLVSESQEIAMGKQTRDASIATYGEYDDPKVQDLVRRIGLRMAAASERPNLPWEFHVLDDEQVNAFAAPGGYVFVTRGILAYMNDEAELASVLGHEIAHVTARHTARQVSQQQLLGAGVLAGMVLSDRLRSHADAIAQGLQLLTLKFSRDDEAQADAIGFRYLLNAGYDVRAAADMFRTLDRVEAASSGGGRLPEWASTHPSPANRVQRALFRADSVHRDMSGAVVNRDGYLRLLDGMTFGADPRNGFFRDTTFYHPDLRLQFAFPAGWATANLADAVVAQAPDQNAVLRFALAQGSPDDAARAFFQQQGVQAGNTTAAPINGQPARTGDFTAQLDDGTAVRGTASFIRYGDHTFAFLGYAAGNAWPARGPAIRQAIGSFAPLTDPAIIAVKPATIQVVALPRAMTLQQFGAQYPSATPPAAIAIINGFDPGTTAPVAAGTTMKRVAGSVP